MARVGSAMNDTRIEDMKRTLFLERAIEAEKRALAADNPNIAEQWRLIAGTWRTMADALPNIE